MLVNNAGYGSYGSLEEVPLDEGRRQFEVNVFGLARLTQLVLPAMRAQGSGAIVNISSIGGKIYEPFGAWYHATKFAVEGLSDSLRLELAPFGIRVIVIEPGAIRSEWSGIARDNLLRWSGAGPYKPYAEAHARMFAPRRHVVDARAAGGGGEDRLAGAYRAAAAHALCRRRRRPADPHAAQAASRPAVRPRAEADLPARRRQAKRGLLDLRARREARLGAFSGDGERAGDRGAGQCRAEAGALVEPGGEHAAEGVAGAGGVDRRHGKRRHADHLPAVGGDGAVRPERGDDRAAERCRPAR